MGGAGEWATMFSCNPIFVLYPDTKICMYIAKKWVSFATGVFSIFLKDGSNHVFRLLRYDVRNK